MTYNPLWEEPIPPLWDIQEFMLDTAKRLWTDRKGVLPTSGMLNLSDCGTGKTRAAIEFLMWLKRTQGYLPPTLVFGTRTILQTAWGDDIDKYSRGFLSYSVCTANVRKEAFEKPAEIYIVNHDAVTWLCRRENQEFADRFRGGIIIPDESTAFKNPTSKRTMQAMWMCGRARFTMPMTGTPMPQSILDMWSQSFLADQGVRLGKSSAKFMASMMIREDVPVVNPLSGRTKIIPRWIAREGAREQVFQLLSDNTVRFDSSRQNLPRCEKHFVYVDLPANVMREYKKLEEQLALYCDQGVIEATTAATLRTKLLQLCGGAVYGIDGETVKFHKERYELVLDLAEESEQALVAFNYKHERDALREMAYERNMKFAIVDGSTSDSDRVLIRDMFQDGRINYIFAHPRSISHGITLTRGRRVVWCGPTDNGETFYQFNKRVNRGGQTHENDIVMVCSRGTKEARAYDGLRLKLDEQASLNYLFATKTENEMGNTKKVDEHLAKLLR